MAKIKSATTCAGDCEGFTGTLLDIHFQNGQSLMLSLKSRRYDPAYLRLCQDSELTSETCG